MADRKASRRFTLAGKTYKKGGKVSLPAGQITDFERAGLVDPLDAEPAPKKSQTTD